MADSYTKLWSSLLDSSVWGEPDHVRLCWITMLAMKNEHGYVGASIDGIARRAVVSLEQAEDAIATLEAPDERSRSSEHDGRRIERVDRGWQVLNHDYFRALNDKEERRRYERERKRRQRDTAGHVRDLSRVSTHADADADIEAPIASLRSAPSSKADESFGIWWALYPKKVGKQAAVKAWKKLKPSPDLAEEIAAAAKSFAAAVRQPQFIPNPATWLNEGRWYDDLEASAACAAPPGRNGQPQKTTHTPNTPLGSLSCSCIECVKYRAKAREDGR